MTSFGATTSTRPPRGRWPSSTARKGLGGERGNGEGQER